ncbi:MAG TPA: cytochrome c oxidase assembly protein [Geminicoccaceae bacterium]
MAAAGRARRLTAGVAVGVILGMLALTAASVPLYRLFCQVTGYGGTTQVAEAGAGRILDRTIKVRFNADVDPDLPWAFRPKQREVEVRIGEERLAFFEAVNHGDVAVVGSATFNVTPHKAGIYFSKLACFCFEEQVLQPGERVDMPVSFYVDPALVEDAGTADVDTITLSYTFFRREAAGTALRGDAAANGPSS